MIEFDLTQSSTLDEWDHNYQANQAFESAYDNLGVLARDLDRLSCYLVRFKVSKDRYEEALSIVREKAEITAHNGIVFSVPLWAVIYAKMALKEAKINYTTEPTK